MTSTSTNAIVLVRIWYPPTKPTQTQRSQRTTTTMMKTLTYIRRRRHRRRCSGSLRRRQHHCCLCRRCSRHRRHRQRRCLCRHSLTFVVVGVVVVVMAAFVAVSIIVAFAVVAVVIVVIVIVNVVAVVVTTTPQRWRGQVSYPCSCGSTASRAGRCSDPGWTRTFISATTTACSRNAPAERNSEHFLGWPPGSTLLERDAGGNDPALVTPMAEDDVDTSSVNGDAARAGSQMSSRSKGLC